MPLHRSVLYLCAALLGLAAHPAAGAGSAPRVSRIDPPNWWEGMRLPEVRLLLTGERLDSLRVESLSAGLRVRRVLPAASPGHLFVDLAVLPGSGGNSHGLLLRRGADTTVVQYPVLRREPGKGRFQGFSPADVIYLITPDRFADGDSSNNTVPGMSDGLRRRDPYGRHGGDIQGILDRLDYLKDLGETAVWINPLVENDMPRASYHGYAATDLYRIDPRFGTNALYARLVREVSEGLRFVLGNRLLRSIAACTGWSNREWDCYKPAGCFPCPDRFTHSPNFKW